MDDQIADFIALTGASAEEATHYLEMGNFDSELAANLFWDMGHIVPAAAAQQQSRSSEEVRRPIEARVDRLIDYPQPIHEISDHADSDADYLFAPPAPAATNTGVPFQTLLARAKQTNKHVLVSIQDPDIFASHVLNRDVWPNEILAEIIAQNFEFFLRDRNSADGRSFASLYRLDKFPVVCILDPRTGRMVKKFDKVVDAALLVEQLTVFLDKQAGIAAAAAVAAAAAAVAAPAAAAAVPAAAVAPAPAAVPAAVPAVPAAAAPELPPAGAAGTVRIAVRLSSGVREQISVFPETPLAVLLQWTSAKEQLAMEAVDLKTAPPEGKSIRHDIGLRETTVASAGLSGALLTVVKL